MTVHVAVCALFDQPQRVSCDMQVIGTQLPQRLMAGGGDAGQILFATPVDDPVVAGKRGASYEQRGDAVDERRVLHSELRRRLDVPGDEPRILDRGLQ